MQFDSLQSFPSIELYIIVTGFIVTPYIVLLPLILLTI
jgi:hypothetical protein